MRPTLEFQPQMRERQFETGPGYKFLFLKEEIFEIQKSVGQRVANTVAAAIVQQLLFVVITPTENEDIVKAGYPNAETLENMRKKSRSIDLGLRDAGKLGTKIGQTGMQHWADVLLELGDGHAGRTIDRDCADLDRLALHAGDTVIARASCLEIEKNIVAAIFPVCLGQNFCLFSA